MAIKIGISGKLMTVVAASIVGLVIAALVALSFLRAVMVEDRETKLRNLVENAESVVRQYHGRAEKGELEPAEAMRQARAMLREQRYDGDEYFFVFSDDGTWLLNPFHPEREGQNDIAAVDSAGQPFIRHLLEAAKAGGGAVFYRYPRPGQTESSDKLSFAKRFGPWGWTIGTGIYIDDIDTVFQQKALNFAGLVLVIGLVTAGLALLIARQITVPLKRLTLVTNRLADQHYDTEVTGTERGDEIGSLACSVRSLRDVAREAADLRRQQEETKRLSEEERRRTALALADSFESRVKNVSDVIASSAGNMKGAAESLTEVARHTASQATSVASAAEQASVNVQTVASAAEELSASINEISRQVQQSAERIATGVAEARRSDELVQGLAVAASRIGDVVKLINDIASQTNLLALNATIEAARAGEAGKGFAVVANEVKSLANQTGRATEEIAAQIGAVQSATDEAVAAIRAIGGTIGEINQIGSAIAAAVEEQHAATAEISRNIQQASAGTREVTDYLGQLAGAVGNVGETSNGVLTASAELDRQSRRLDEEVHSFLAGIRA
ncbi:methyl-accepting chemotaxis protein [Phaeospirillum tilakii]|uniref:Methyl-accepting chemotaxis protein n=1 Tax=Phaeospirillum tilakii TaxID=741673 RepID=A0ABW5CCQ6_9PROT